MSKYQFDVQVQPEYLPEQSSPDSGVFSFAYTITITNTGDTPAQLISRHWVISDARGHTEEVKGDRKSTRLNSSHIQKSRMPSSA